MCKTFKTLVMLLMLLASRVSHSEEISIIQDLELEDMILSISRPIFSVAKLDTESMKVYILSDPSINAFAYYSNIVVNTGLIVFSENSSTLFGVLSHEAGHVARKHMTRMFVRSQNDLEKYGRASLLLAALLIVITPAAATAVLQSAILTPAIGLSALMQNKLRYSRDNEIEADESAIKYLKLLHKPLDGLYETMMFFHQSLPTNATVYKYMMTHPLPEERLDRLQIARTEETTKILEYDCDIEKKLRRSQAKIFGYLDYGQYEVKQPIDRPGRCFTQSDLNFYAKYRDLHIAWKNKKYKKALKICNNLLTQNPDDVFLKETKSLLLFHDGEIEEGLLIYREVIQKINTLSAKFNLAYHLSSSEKKEYIEESIPILKEVIETDKNPAYYSQLAFAYKALGDEVSFFVYSAEASFYAQNFPVSMELAQRAIVKIKKLPSTNNTEFLQNKAQDIMDAILSKGKKKKLKTRKKLQLN